MEYLPLHILNTVSKKHPNAWAYMENIHQSNGKNGSPAWPDWCYAPMAAALAVAAQSEKGLFGQLRAVYDAQQIDALAPWRISKEVFIIDESLEQMLFQQADDASVPAEILMQIPYPCFYIQFHHLEFQNRTISGAFVHLEYDVKNNSSELRILFAFPDGSTLGFPIHINAGNLENSEHITVQEAIDAIGTDSPLNALRGMMQTENNAIKIALGKVLQIVLYLCAQNAEISPNKEQTTVYKRGAKIRDSYAEIRKWDVGVRIGATVKASAQSSTSNSQPKEHSTHASPRPHMRRGHWHNFWTGSRSKPDERKLVLKWVAPTFIGDQDETPIVIHNVK